VAAQVVAPTALQVTRPPSAVALPSAY